MSYNANESKKYLINSYNFIDITFQKGEGSYLIDDKNNRYLDFTSGIGVNILGHANKDIIRAISEQANKLLHISNNYLNKNTILAAKNLCNLSGMNKVFFSNSGAESNEGAIKIARKYSYDKYGAKRGTILTLKQSFHGRTMSTLKATGQEKFHKYFFPFPEGFKYAEANNFNSVLENLDNTVCAIMIEVIQGEGGIFPLDKKFINNLIDLCEKRDILLIVDEVQTGIGRTGYFLAYQYYNMRPDIVTLAKGLGGGVPIGAILCSEKTKDVISYGEHGSTFGGNPFVTNVANVILEKFFDDSFLQDINDKSKFMFENLNNFKSDNIVDIRGRGLMIGIEVKGDINKYVTNARENGLLILTAGNNTLRILPPLNIEKKDLIKGLEILKKII
ncbi:aspartate aminotransferase family protein [Clostridium mediterraneense]|uniref:aspartate aminotransferase family protein n=1 Tax=Clostridium mediterraneense TaxID=1805472 RepID=UPI000834B3B7|nr:aspartate aminotransferase family protein [Clostridium mediterraneense]